jgi:hypothetical protein
VTTEINTEEKPWLPTAEEMWAFLKDLSKSQAETSIQIKETSKQMKETDKQMGKLSNRFGDVIEYMFALPAPLTKPGELSTAMMREQTGIPQAAAAKRRIIMIPPFPSTTRWGLGLPAMSTGSQQACWFCQL